MPGRHARRLRVGPVIGTLLVGGLGNQMFQYAAARALALRHRTRVCLDRSAFGRPDLFAVARPFDLGRFDIEVRSASPATNLSFALARRRSSVLRRLSGWKTFREAGLDYDPAFERLPDRSYLFGYWQSWRYFDEYAARIAQDFQPVAPLAPRNSDLRAVLREENSVFIHVRRGDYVATPEVLAHHGVLGLDYYEAAIRLLKQRVGAFHAFVFSDDLPWCRTAFAQTGIDLTFVEGNDGAESWQDMELMAACRHGIIANSSFSWWGAWLGDQRAQHDGRSVVAPRRWLAARDQAEGGRCPPHWTLL